ncbi:MAG: aminotransferase class V-fold PLP-dependent enzyme [Candidatus Zixiibacteriota bacterium]|nr:MAG: aminotransferase class V-fold PLP-dependent enzyme [candidate division Zixibacteria bacterium]
MDEIIYLDNAATSWPKPDSVYEFALNFYRRTGVNPGRSGFDKAIEAGNILEDLRKRLNRFFGNDEEAWSRVCFGYNATDALNLIIRGLLKPGDHVIATNLEHNSVIRPVNHAVRDQGVEATYVPFNDAGFIEPEAIRQALRPNTRLVVCTHGSNVLGTVQPIGKIGAVCREAGVPFVVDTAQTAGVIPINMREMNVDALAFTGHKSLMGFTGIGGLVVRGHLDICQTRSGGTGVRSAYPYHLEEYPFRMEYGTPNLVGVASLWAGQDWIEQQGMDNIYQHEMRLTRKLVTGLWEIERVKVYACSDLDHHLSTVTINVEGIEAGDVGIMLDVDHNIAVRTGLHCAPLAHQQIGTDKVHGGVRFAVGAFNTEADIDAAIKAVGEIAARKR